MRPVYHFTNTRCLASILRDGMLWPTDYDFVDLAHAMGGAALVWATIDPAGEPPDKPWATVAGRCAVATGTERPVRITLRRRGFITWETLCRRRFQQIQASEDGGWLDEADEARDRVEHIFGLYEQGAENWGTSVEKWCVHPGPVPIRRALKIEIRTAASRWRTFKSDDGE